jgi:hypothetical protein
MVRAAKIKSLISLLKLLPHLLCGDSALFQFREGYLLDSTIKAVARLPQTIGDFFYWENRVFSVFRRGADMSRKAGGACVGWVER